MCKASQTSTIFCKCLRSQPLIKVDQLEKTFGTVKALDGASFSADDGKITALLQTAQANQPASGSYQQSFNRALAKPSFRVSMSEKNLSK